MLNLYNCFGWNSLVLIERKQMSSEILVRHNGLTLLSLFRSFPIQTLVSPEFSHIDCSVGWLTPGDVILTGIIMLNVTSATESEQFKLWMTIIFQICLLHLILLYTCYHYTFRSLLFPDLPCCSYYSLLSSILCTFSPSALLNPLHSSTLSTPLTLCTPPPFSLLHPPSNQSTFKLYQQRYKKR